MELTLDKVAALLKKHHKYVITAHLNPDGDAIGSLLALAHHLESIGKDVTCLIDDEIPDNFKFLAGCDKIKQPDMRIGDVDLLIVLDSSDLDRIGRVIDVVSAPILNIDHHISNKGFADYLCLDARQAATGVIIFDLLQCMSATITPEIANSLYMAIATDCGFFRYANTNVHTMEAGAELIRCGACPHIISEELEKRPMQSLKILARVLDSLELFADGKIGCVTITADIAEAGTTEGFIDFARVVEGVDVAVMVKYAGENACRISMRSKEVDVSAIAMSFGGGGHQRAAGCTIRCSLKEAKQIILEAVTKSLGRVD